MEDKTVLEDVGKSLRKKICISEFKKIDWTGILDEMNVDLANSKMEEKILSVMNVMAPMKVIQNRVKYQSWVSDATKQEMTTEGQC